MPRLSKDAAMIRCAPRTALTLLLLVWPLLAAAEPGSSLVSGTPESAHALSALSIDGGPEAEDGDDDDAAPDGVLAPYAGPDGIRPGLRPGGRPLRLYRNAMVESLIRFFTEQRRDVLERGWRRSGRYMAMIRRVFRAEGVPEQLAYLAAVESNFNPHARSPARAVGMWQFTAPTARKFGLRIQRPWYDERIDPESSTHAAARLLAYLFDRYENWELALAAYNAGEARVNEALERARRHGRPQDYWSLRLPRQTQGFVPAFLAIATIMEAPQEHGLDGLEREPSLESEALELAVAASLADLAGRLGLEREALAARNPAWKGGMIPPLGVGAVLLWVPPGTGGRLAASLAQEPPKPIPWLVHTVQEGDTVSDVARRYGVRTRDVLDINHLHWRSLLAIGQPLLVPVAADTPVLAATNPEPQFVPEAAAVPAVTQLRLHRVQSGESLWSIARQYGVRMAELRLWNRLADPMLRPDQELVVYLPGDWTAVR
jgi:membrane-bound lytic murein transglycosylase D